MSGERERGRRRVRVVTTSVAAVAVAGSVGVAALVAAERSDGAAETATTDPSVDSSTVDEGSSTWTPSTSGVTSGRGGSATSGGS